MSPKIQLQLVGEPVDVSVKKTVRLLIPDVGYPVKFATGNGIDVVAVVVGWVVVVVLVIVNAFASVPDCPSGLVTVRFHVPVWVLGSMTNWQVIFVAEIAFTPAPAREYVPRTSLTATPGRKLVPVMPVIFAVVPTIPDAGVMPVTAGAGRVVVVAVGTGAVVGAVVAAGVATGT